MNDRIRTRATAAQGSIRIDSPSITDHRTMTRPSPAAPAAALAACLAIALLATAPIAAATECRGPQAVGYRVLHDAAGLPLAVWYPSGSTERRK
jgi:hypothetical protein